MLRNGSVYSFTVYAYEMTKHICLPDLSGIQVAYIQPHSFEKKNSPDEAAATKLKILYNALDKSRCDYGCRMQVYS